MDRFTNSCTQDDHGPDEVANSFFGSLDKRIVRQPAASGAHFSVRSRVYNTMADFFLQSIHISPTTDIKDGVALTGAAFGLRL